MSTDHLFTNFLDGFDKPTLLLGDINQVDTNDDELGGSDYHLGWAVADQGSGSNDVGILTTKKIESIQ